MDKTKLDINKTYKHGPECMLSELTTIKLLYVGYNLVVYRYTGSNVEKSMGLQYWLEYSHITDIN